MAKEKIILFDLDGTLIDSIDAIYESFCLACVQNGLQIPDIESLKLTIGHTLENMFLSFGATNENLSLCIEAYRHCYKNICLQKTKMLPNATQSIQLASEFASLGVVTTKTSRFSKEILEHFDVLKYFQTIIGIEDVTFPKPHKEPILKALSVINPNISLSKAFMIGDTILDIQAAIDAEICPVGVKSGYGKLEEMYKYCSDIFDDSLGAVRFIQAF